MISKRVGACILAAGYSSRMGAFKPLLPLGETTVIERSIAAAKAAGIGEIAVVTGYRREELQPILAREKVREVYNRNFDSGMFSSIQAGAAAMPAELDGFFLMPVDCPLTEPKILRQLMDAAPPGEDSFVVPCYRGKKGHPLLIPSCYRKEIAEHGGRGGLKAITDRDYRKMKRIPVDFEGVLMDMDDRAGYDAVLDYLAAGCRSENLHELARGRRFFLIRHGEIRQHKEKIFLGQTDVPLSDRGKSQAADAAERMAKEELLTDRIYSSDLLRALETAEPIAELCGKRIALEPGFREMNLGAWDGKFIREIKEKFPKEYEQRGRNLFTYKQGHGSENFFDLQYRVYKTMVRILKEDENRDLVIVAHSGVLRGIAQNLRGKDIADDWEKMKNGEILVLDTAHAEE